MTQWTPEEQTFARARRRERALVLEPTALGADSGSSATYSL